jgi:hypothetical protein
MSTSENVSENAISIKELASRCRQEHAEIKNNILALRKTIESGLAHLTREDLLLVGANIKTLSNLLSDLDSYIAAIQVRVDMIKLSGIEFNRGVWEDLTKIF